MQGEGEITDSGEAKRRKRIPQKPERRGHGRRGTQEGGVKPPQH
jgi:hypothetical protein